MPAWFRYSLARVAVFAGVLTVLLLIGFEWLWAALLATVIAFCVSFILLRGPREAAAQEFAALRPRRTSDERAEDAADDADAAVDRPADAAPSERERGPEA